MNSLLNMNYFEDFSTSIHVQLCLIRPISFLQDSHAKGILASYNHMPNGLVANVKLNIVQYGINQPKKTQL